MKQGLARTSIHEIKMDDKTDSSSGSLGGDPGSETPPLQYIYQQSFGNPDRIPVKRLKLFYSL